MEEADLQESFTSTRNKHNSYYVLESNFQEARLLKANFKKTRFSGFVYANFKNAWVSGADFSEAYLHGNFENAILRSTIFKNAILDFTSFKNANLRGADFTNATLNESIFENALMINASFVGVKRLDTETIISACFWDKAIYKKNETENLEYIKELKENTAYNSEEEKTRCHNWTRDPIYIFDNPFPLQWEPFWETEFEASIEGKKHLFSHYEQIKRNEDIKKCVSKNEFNYWKLLEAVILLSIIVFNLWLLGIFRWCIKKVML